MKETYNSKATIALLEKIADTTQVITRAELINVLTDGKGMKADLSGFLYQFKKRALTPLGIKLETLKPDKPLKKGEHCAYRVYRALAPVVVDNTATHALERDNQKLFLELEELKKQYDILEREYRETARREASYKALVQTYHTLTMGV